MRRRPPPRTAAVFPALRQRGRRAPVPGEEPGRRATAGAKWGAPSRRARALAAALAVAFALITFAVVSREWRRAAPPLPPPPASIEARLVATPAPAAAATPQPGR